MSQHTPGPWTVSTILPTVVIQDNDEERWICQLPLTPEGVANARLIAAAPRMLEALRKLVNEAAGFLALSDLERHGMTNSRCLRDRIEQARDVIATVEAP